jgi:predicted metalloprotease
VLGVDPSQLGAIVQPGGGGQGAEASTLREQCRTGEDANRREDCQILGYVNSIQDYWSEAYQNYQPADTVIFESAVSTGCGTASSQVGPFYCPNDRQIYLDLGFFDVMRTQLGAEDASLARGYVVAHEYGHHIQNLQGILSQAQSGGTGANSPAVRIELMADCFAGVWASHAETTGFLEPLTQEQISHALDAAAAVGDDRIQQKMEGQVDPHRWTHGSAEQRQQWFTTGYQEGNPNSCDTFAQ